MAAFAVGTNPKLPSVLQLDHHETVLRLVAKVQDPLAPETGRQAGPGEFES